MKKEYTIPLELEGINKTMYEWAIDSALLKSILGEEIDSGALLIKILGKDVEQRELASLTLYQHIWARYPDFGPNLLINLLPEFEHNRVFYDNYRDHTTHMIKCFLLGMYFYDSCSIFKEVVKDSSIFTKTWVLTSLYHDIGYIVENDFVNPKEEYLVKFMNMINKTLFAPLSNIPLFSSELTKTRERKIIDKFRIYTGNIQEISEFEEEELFKPLHEYGAATNLSTSKKINGVYKYYTYARSNKTKDGRNGFRDHGISSSVIFIKLWNLYKEYIIEIYTNKKILDEFSLDVKQKIESLYSDLQSDEALVDMSIGAIALHNINKDLWDEDDALVSKLDFKKFHISFKQQKLFFAFLLRLCDEIQLWDRIRYRKPEASDKSIYGADLDIYAIDNKIYISFNEDYKQFVNPETTENSSFRKLFDTLQKYLNNEELKDLLLCKRKEDINKIRNVPSNNEENEKIIPPIEKNETRSIEDLQPWVVGAVNIDEDVHFSSYYLRQSMEAYLPSEFKGLGYENIIAVYEDFNETYYIPLKECEKVSNNLIQKSLENPLFMDGIIEKVTKLIYELRDIFDFEPNKNMFTNMTDAKLAEYYQKHDEIHAKLYVYARIPEALDRGVSTFTNYLKTYLKEKNDELHNEKKLNEIFEILTYPENISLSGMEILELYQLILDIKKNERDIEYKTFSSSGRRTLIRMNYDTYHKVENFANKWAFWGYHGYGHRAIRDFNYFVEKLKIEIDNPNIKEQQDRIVNAMSKAATERILNFSRYNIDEKHQLLFRAFSKIGTVKILRRYYQLRNFYYLDNLILEIAKRNKVSEGTIRCLLPDEVIKLLRGEKNILEYGKSRVDSLVFAVLFKNNEKPEFLLNDKAKDLYDKMKKLTKVKTLNEGQLRGDTASLGKYKGICRIVTRNEDSVFEKGDIFVGVDTDPDLFDKLKIAGAVLTESGGLTCHAAIVCRELKIPCIVRINGLMDYVKDGDILDVNADNGIVTISTSISKNIIKSVNAKKIQVDEKLIGRKAYALLQMKANNILVPEFFCVPYKVLKKVFCNIELDNKGQESQALILEIKNAVKELGGPLFAIRSSTLNEDLENISGAGQEITELRVAKDDVINTLIRLVDEYESNLIDGSIIVQKMILGDLSGVMFTKNPLNEENGLLIEAVPGGNEYLTSGKISPVTYTWDTINLDYIEKSGDIWNGLLDRNKLDSLNKIATKLEKLFNAPQDIEWTILREKLYVLQSRNITGKEQVDSALIFSHKTKRSRNILSIYQVYALPINLQQHMLRVAAVALWILDRWKGAELNEKDITETLLLHDIGNLVKVTEDKFESLFPDTYPMESFQYWRNIRKSIIQRYGKTDTEATSNIVKEIGVSNTVMNMLEKKQFVNNIDTYNNNDYAIKICAYADQRVSPNGVLSLENRLNEAIIRYRGVKNASVNSSNREELVEYAKKIEQQLFEFIDGKPDDITDSAITNYIEKLKNFQFS